MPLAGGLRSPDPPELADIARLLAALPRRISDIPALRRGARTATTRRCAKADRAWTFAELEQATRRCRARRLRCRRRARRRSRAWSSAKIARRWSRCCSPSRGSTRGRCSSTRGCPRARSTRSATTARRAASSTWRTLRPRPRAHAVRHGAARVASASTAWREVAARRARRATAPPEPCSDDPGNAGRRAALHHRHHRRPEGRDADASQPAVHRQGVEHAAPAWSAATASTACCRSRTSTDSRRCASARCSPAPACSSSRAIRRRRWLRALAHDGITVVQGVPAMYAKLLELPAARAGTPSLRRRLRFVYAGGSPLDPALKARRRAPLRPHAAQRLRPDRGVADGHADAPRRAAHRLLGRDRAARRRASASSTRRDATWRQATRASCGCAAPT